MDFEHCMYYVGARQGRMSDPSRPIFMRLMHPVYRVPAFANEFADPQTRFTVRDLRALGLSITDIDECNWSCGRWSLTSSRARPSWFEDKAFVRHKEGLVLLGLSVTLMQHLANLHEHCALIGGARARLFVSKIAKDFAVLEPAEGVGRQQVADSAIDPVQNRNSVLNTFGRISSRPLSVLFDNVRVSARDVHLKGRPSDKERLHQTIEIVQKRAVLLCTDPGCVLCIRPYQTGRLRGQALMPKPGCLSTKFDCDMVSHRTEGTAGRWLPGRRRSRPRILTHRIV